MTDLTPTQADTLHALTMACQRKGRDRAATHDVCWELYWDESPPKGLGSFRFMPRVYKRLAVLRDLGLVRQIKWSGHSHLWEIVEPEGRP